MIHLEKITKDNLFPIVKLWETLDSDQKTSVAPNVVSIAQAYVDPEVAWPRAIFEGEEPVGFVMMSLHDTDIPDEDQPAYYLWRFMVTRSRQGQGIGRKVLDILIEKCREDGIKYLYVSCTMNGPMPYKFYIGYGFVDTHQVDDEEEILKLRIESKPATVTSGN
ncbi:MAG: GNAT family N-acetyltransferase [Bacilli bacterium]|jgi:diamine N-acetyltransferase